MTNKIEKEKTINVPSEFNKIKKEVKKSPREGIRISDPLICTCMNPTENSKLEAITLMKRILVGPVLAAL